MLKQDVNPYFSNFAISFIGYFSKAIYNSFKIIGLYPNCHIAYLFKPRPGLFSNGMWIYSEYVLKGEAVHEI